MTEAELKALAAAAKADQVEAINNAKSAFEAYWAGSAYASAVHHCRRGAVRTIKARAK